MPEYKTQDEYNEVLKYKSLPDRLRFISKTHPTAVFTTSLSREDQVLLWWMHRSATPLRTITLQTGRLFPETNSLLSITRETYGIEIEEIEPDAEAVADYVQKHGLNGFYESPEARKSCCFVRKIEPLGRVLETAGAWITGLTREQSTQREGTPFAQWDDRYRIMKFNPLSNISQDEIDSLVTDNDIPVNELHSRGYPSIGCEPCTRATKPDEHIRAGRWWWEQNASSECGLHTSVSTPNTVAQSAHQEL